MTDLTVRGTWIRDGVEGRLLSWQNAWGPPTEAYLLRPVNAGSGPLPGVLALHSHDGSMWYGKEKIADGPTGAPVKLAKLRESAYGGTAFANELAKQGFQVLVHDAFPWGSRRASLDELESGTRDAIREPLRGTLEHYDRVARDHEHTLEKCCRIEGSSLSEVVLSEDLAALEVLRGSAGVDPSQVAVIGLSGGGLRAALLKAYSPHVSASVIVGMMSSFRHFTSSHIASHTWMFFPPGIGTVIPDWPDLVASNSSPLLVLYNEDDEFFPRDGMRAAHLRLQALYRQSGSTGYAGQFFPGPHRFDGPMQDAAFSWLKARLAAG